MSNISSDDDLDIDACISVPSILGHTQFQPETESDLKHGYYANDDFSSELSTKHPAVYQARIPESEDIYPNVEKSFTPESVDAVNMTVAKDTKEVKQKVYGENIAGTVKPVKVQENETVEDHRVVQLNDQFSALALAEGDDSGNAMEEAVNINALLIRDEDGDTLLHQAIIMDETLMATLLIEFMVQNGLVNLNTQNLLFQTPLHLAVITEQMDVIQTLVAKGADLTVRDKNGRTPFHIACEMQRPDIVNCLLSALEKDSLGHDRPKAKREKTLDIKNYEGEGCVHIAAKCRNVTLMKCLIQHGANGNLSDEKSGRTALHFAAENNDIDMVRYLLGVSGVNSSPETMSEETPILLAYLRDLEEIVELFRTYRNT